MKKIKIFFSCLFVFVLLSHVKSQTQIKELNIDSLLKVNDRYQKQDETKLKLLIALAYNYPGINPSKGIETGEQAIVIAQKLNNQQLLAEAYNNTGLNYVGLGDYSTAMELYEKALSINQTIKNTFGIAHDRHNMGHIYRLKSDYKKAIGSFEEAIILFDSIRDKTGIAMCYDGIGVVYSYSSNSPKALEYHQKALAINEQLGNKSGMANSYNGLGLVYRSYSEYAKALGYFQKAFALNEQLGNKANMAKNLTNIGTIYRYLSDYPKALEYLQKSLTINTSIGNKAGMVLALNGIAVIHSYISDYPRALECFQKTLALNEQIGNKSDAAFSLNGIGASYSSLSDLPKALEYFQKALEINEQIGSKDGVVANLANLGSVYIKVSDYTKALECFQKSLAIDEEFGRKTAIATNLNSIARLYMTAPDSVLTKMGINPAERDQKSLECLNRSLLISREIKDLRTEKSTLRSLSTVYEKQGDFPKAYDTYKKYIVLRDSIESGEIKQKIDRKTMQYEFDKKETEFKFQQQLSNEKLLRSNQEAALSRQQLQLSNKEKDLQHLAFLKEKAEKTQNENLLALSQKEKELQLAALKSLSKEKDLQQTALQLSLAEVKSKNQQRNAFLVGMFLFLALSFFIYRNFVGQRKSNKIIQAGNLELKETQSQLVQQEKLASLGALTAGIAHEIKNPLNFVNNFAELSNELIDELDGATTQKEKSELLQLIKQNLSKINEHGKRADSIVKNMLEHSRTGTGEKQTTDINKLSEEFLNLAYHGMRANIKDFNCAIEKNLDANLPKLNVVQQDISRVILNLINNAFYAIKDKPEAKLILSTRALANTVAISVKDNGTGMPEKIKQKIFEPFFTTKPSGSGTGLGLSLSFDIIKAHGGKIEVQSEEGIGTEFMITLPI